MPCSSFADSYAIDWYKMAGGGGTSSNSQYTVSGTIGQTDASGVMTGGGYSLTGGFWSIIATVPSSAVPDLAVTFVSPSSVVISWADTGSYTLQQNPNLAGGNWSANTNSITTLNGTNSITIRPARGNLFFRLSQP